MRRMATLLAAAAVVASGLSVTSAFAHEGWRGGEDGWRGHEWREQTWRRHEWWEHQGRNYNRYYAPRTYYATPGVVFGFTDR